MYSTVWTVGLRPTTVDARDLHHPSPSSDLVTEASPEFLSLSFIVAFFLFVSLQDERRAQSRSYLTTRRARPQRAHPGPTTRLRPNTTHDHVGSNPRTVSVHLRTAHFPRTATPRSRPHTWGAYCPSLRPLPIQRHSFHIHPYCISARFVISLNPTPDSPPQTFVS